MNPVKLNDLDPSFKHRVAAQPGGEGIRACYACKACSAACPVEAVEKRYDPRKIIRKALLGMVKEVIDDDFIWLCSTCYGCHEVCPQNVSLTEVMFAIKNLAVLEGHSPPALKAQRNLLKEHGRLYEVTEFENEKREKMGLPPITEHAEDYDRLLP
jgi:heterodisulfide reductase subunit C